jgi:hypothetical protein
MNKSNSNYIMVFLIIIFIIVLVFKSNYNADRIYNLEKTCLKYMIELVFIFLFFFIFFIFSQFK